MLLRYAKQNNYFIIYISFLVLVTNAGRIHLTKNKKIVSLIFNYFCSGAYFCFKKNPFRRQNYKNLLKYAKIFAYFAKKQYFCTRVR